MKEEARNKLLEELSKAPDSQLDKSMCEYLKGLIGKNDKEVKEGLKYALDQSANASLASGFVMTLLHTMWVALGGKVEHKPEEGKENVIKDIEPEKFVPTINALLEEGKEQQALVEIYGFFRMHIYYRNVEVVEKVLSDPKILEWSPTILLGVIIATKEIRGKSEARKIVFNAAYEKFGDRAHIVFKDRTP